MTLLVIFLQVFGLALLALVIRAIIKCSVRPNNFPPGPLGLPMVGYVPFLDPKNLGKSFRRLGIRYGDVFSIFLGTSPVVILNSYSAIKEAFDKTEMSGRPEIFSGTFFQKGKAGISTTEGPLWEKQRSFLHQHLVRLVSGAGAAGFHDLVMDEVHDIKMEFAKKVGEPSPISYHLNISIINILWTIASGRRLHSQQQEFQSVYECIDKITQFMSRAAIISFMPFLTKIVPESISKMEKGRYHRNRFLAISKKWIREHREEYRGNRTGDFADSYLKEIDDGTESFTEESLGAILREMFVIGAETESVLLRWAFKIFSVHREVQRKIQDEIDGLVGSDDVKWEHREKLHYTRAALAEVQRYSDITPTAIGHKTMSDVSFRGFLLPKGTLVMANMTSCHRDPKFWEKPLEFYPEHFLDDEGRFMDNKEGFLPFGSGVRRCPGEDIAKMETFLILTNVLKTFTLRPPPGEKIHIGTQYEVGTGFLRNPKPYKVLIQNRE